jgi:hypothetical protein
MLVGDMRLFGLSQQMGAWTGAKLARYDAESEVSDGSAA